MRSSECLLLCCGAFHKMTVLLERKQNIATRIWKCSYKTSKITGIFPVTINGWTYTNLSYLYSLIALDAGRHKTVLRLEFLCISLKVSTEFRGKYLSSVNTENACNHEKETSTCPWKKKVKCFHLHLYLTLKDRNDIVLSKYDLILI